MKRKDILKTGLAGILGVSLFMGGASYAYLQNSTDSVVNQFQAYLVNVDLTETTGDSYKIVPGTTAKKDPTVYVDAGLPVYVFVEVTDATNGYVQYVMNDQWTALDGFENVYYTESDGTEARAFSVLAGDQVTYPEQSNESMAGAFTEEGLSLTFQAHAIQKDPFVSAQAAYKAVKGLEIVAEAPEVTVDEIGRTVYQIRTAGNILWLSDFVNNEPMARVHDDSKKIVFRMENNIDMENTLMKPIGITSDNAFWGIFDGQNFTLSNVVVQIEDADDHGAALFGNMKGTVKDLHIDTISVTGGKYTGAVVGHAYETGATISNVHVENATVKNVRTLRGWTGGLGGLVAYKMENCSIKNSTIIVDVLTATRTDKICKTLENPVLTNNTAENVVIKIA